MAWDMFQSIIRELGPYLFQVDLFNWGEALLNRRLLDMIDSLKSYDIKIRLSTSLALPLSDEFLKGLILSGIDYLVLSIDGMSQQTYETYRVDGDFHLAMSNMEKLAQLKHRLKADKPRLEWQYLVFSFNEHELPKAERHARRIGVEFRPAAPYVDLNQHPDWLSSDPRFVREPYKAAMASGKKRSEGVSGSFGRPLREVTFSPAEDKCEVAVDVSAGKMGSQTLTDMESRSPSPQRYQCDWHYLKACINADATVSPCCGLYPGEPSWGESGKETFHQIWNNANFKEARKTLAEGCQNEASEIICARCPLPEIQHDGRSVLLDALMDAPRHYKKLARPVLRSLPFRDRLERHSLRIAGKILRCFPYFSRDLLRRSLRHQIRQGVLRKGMEALFKQAAH